MTFPESGAYSNHAHITVLITVILFQSKPFIKFYVNFCDYWAYREYDAVFIDPKNSR